MNKSILLGAFAITTITAQAAVVFTTGFSGRTTDNGTKTISSVAWTGDDTASLSSDMTITSMSGNFLNVAAGTDEAGDPVGVGDNIKNGGTWSTVITFTPATTVSLDTFDISSYSISGGGAHQVASHDVNWALAITDGATSVFGANQTITEPGGNAPVNFSLDATGTTLNAGTAYTFTLAVTGPTETGGNNIALNSLTLTSVPEPSAGALLGLGGLALILRRRK